MIWHIVITKYMLAPRKVHLKPSLLYRAISNLLHADLPLTLQELLHGLTFVFYLLMGLFSWPAKLELQLWILLVFFFCLLQANWTKCLSNTILELMKC